jgi:hypothetical protein
MTSMPVISDSSGMSKPKPFMNSDLEDPLAAVVTVAGKPSRVLTLSMVDHNNVPEPPCSTTVGGVASVNVSASQLLEL